TEGSSGGAEVPVFAAVASGTLDDVATEAVVSNVVGSVEVPLLAPIPTSDPPEPAAPRDTTDATNGGSTTTAPDPSGTDASTSTTSEATTTTSTATTDATGGTTGDGGGGDGDGGGNGDTVTGDEGTTTTTTTQPRLVERQARTFDGFDEDDPVEQLLERLRREPADPDAGGFDLATGEGFAVVDVDDVLGPLVDPGEFRGAFVDRCAEGRFGDCPIGVPAVVLGPIGSGNPPLDILSSRGVDPDDSDYRCSFAETGPFDPAIVVFTTNPSALDITYRLPPDDFGQTLSSRVTVDPPGPDDPERVRWQGRLDEGTVTDGPPFDWVQRCIVLPALGERPATHTVDVVATDVFGARATTTNYATPVRLEYPLPQISYRPEGRVRFGVVADANEGGFAYPIDVSDGTDTTCTDIEASHLSGRRTPSFDHPDPLISQALDLGYTSLYRDGNQRRWDYEFPFRAGRTYVVCGWIYVTGERAVDLIDVVHRYQYEVRMPNRHRAIVRVRDIVVRDGAALGDDATISVSTVGGSGPCGPSSTEGRRGAGTAYDGPGRYTLQQTICDPGGYLLPNRMPITLTVRSEGRWFSQTLGAIQIDADKYCDDEDPCTGGAPSDLYVLPIDGLEDCPECGLVGSVGIAVDYRPSYGQGSTSATADVGLVGEFAGDPDPDPVGPPRWSDFEAVAIPDRVDALRVTFVSDRPVTPTIDYLATSRYCSDVTATGPLATDHDILVEGLCADEPFGALLTLVDEDGRSAEWGFTRGTAGRTNAIRGSFGWTLRLAEVQTDRVAERCAAIEESWQSESWNVELPAACDEWLEMSGIDVEIDGFRDHVAQEPCVVPGPALADDLLQGVEVSNVEEVRVQFTLLLDGCGGPDRWSWLEDASFVEYIFFGEVDQTFVVAPEALDDGIVATGIVDVHGLVFEIDFSFNQLFPRD
ncbi:MAG: hypothetical protein R3290_12170, partial [Acidimicrobiia bacterium]|nr:hypothetical protein [Acidimicrobiia bacterium]